MDTVNSKWAIICYGNILRSQVLEQYLRHHAARQGVDVSFFSAGVAGCDEFPDKEKLFEEIHDELDRRNIPHELNRSPWDSAAEEKIAGADIVICADYDVKETVLSRMGNRIKKEDIHTFYEIINEGEVGFQDTYDYEKKRQDPVRFHDAFDELERIAIKILSLKAHR